jgi:hypothetical protein
MQLVARQLQQLDYNNGEEVFSMWSVLRCYLEDSWGDPVSCQLRIEFCMGVCEDKTLAREAEESPLLEAAARERQKTQ